MTAAQRAIGIGLTLLALGLGGCDEPAADLIVSVPSPALRVAETGILRVSIAARATIPTATLTLDAPRGIEASPPSFTLTGLAPVGGNSPPPTALRGDPPALGVVQIRNFSLKALEPGDHRLTVTLTHDGRNVSQAVVLAVRGD